jgi:hypothetical protein
MKTKILEIRRAREEDKQIVVLQDELKLLEEGVRMLHLGPQTLNQLLEPFLE